MPSADAETVSERSHGFLKSWDEMSEHERESKMG